MATATARLAGPRMNLWRLEWLRVIRTPRALALGAVFVFFGLLQPVLTGPRPACRRRAMRSGEQNDLAVGVAASQQPEGVPHLGQRERRGYRDLQLAGIDQPGEFAEHLGARAYGIALGLDPVPGHGVEVGDRVDAFRP